MDLDAFAQQLIAADELERIALLMRHTLIDPIPLAWVLKGLYDNVYTADPVYAATIAAALLTLAQSTLNEQVMALAHWTGGLVAMDEGRLAEAIIQLDASEARFRAHNQLFEAASTQLGKMQALAMLGSYEEALACGSWAREIFAEAGNLLATGKIEQNLGNLYFVSQRYGEAEAFYRQARERFVIVDNQKQLAQLDNSLATTLTSQHKFREAETLYEQALVRAQTTQLEITQAEIECNLGCLALYQGRYDRALDYLERSRRRYTALGMAHELAIADQELADAYLELNLMAEAAAIYTQVTPIFAELGLRAEQARALAYHGRACLGLGQVDTARALLMEARTLYAALELPVGEALVLLTEAHLDYHDEHYSAAVTAITQAETAFAKVNGWTWLLQTHWLRGELARSQGEGQMARTILENTLREATDQRVPQIMQRCWSSLGLLALTQGDLPRAEADFKQAVVIIEELRAPLPAEEFRMGFMGDKLTSYTELVRLCLADGSQPRIIEALGYVERARSRALVDMLAGAGPIQTKARDEFEAELLARLQALREELNWYYSRINRTEGSEGSRSATELNTLQNAVGERETEILTLLRQLQQRNEGIVAPLKEFDLAQLQADLGTETVLVEYFSVDHTLLAFVVTATQIEVVELPGSESAVNEALQQFHFQLGAFRYGLARVNGHLPRLVARTRHHLATLYDLLLRPLADRLGARRLLVAPYRGLHYVPFHALYDGAHYVIEKQEVCLIPSATVLHHCLAMPKRPLHRALLVGAPDLYAPRVQDEIVSLAPLFPEAVTLLNEQATQAEIRAHAPTADVLHFACHGRFRPDNPLFSSLRLADGWMTVRDAYQLDLNCSLVTLSACETGLSALAPGDDLIGLARGFFLAGAPTLLVSLWPVDDALTAQFMRCFYQELLAGVGPAAALRHAQCQLLTQQPHPFFWSPFILLGRWA